MASEKKYDITDQRRLIEQARDAIKTFLFYFDDGTGKHRALVKARETLAALNEWLEVK